jgi:metal-sulfur cluster biosynthetic enzyme
MSQGGIYSLREKEVLSLLKKVKHPHKDMDIVFEQVLKTVTVSGEGKVACTLVPDKHFRAIKKEVLEALKGLEWAQGVTVTMDAPPTDELRKEQQQRQASTSPPATTGANGLAGYNHTTLRH